MYKHIKELREDADCTQQSVASLLNVTQATYSRYESGASDIPTPLLITLAKHYKTSVDYLLDLTNEKTAYKPI